MADLDDQDQQVRIPDLIDNPETANPDTVELVLIRQWPLTAERAESAEACVKRN